MNRRKFLSGLVTASTIGVAGCGGGGSTPTPTATQTAVSETIYDKTEKIPKNEYVSVEFSLDNPATLEAEMETVTGPPIDLFTFTADQFSTYSSAVEEQSWDTEIEYIEDASAPNASSVTTTGELEAGDYVFVIDNTPLGGASPQFEIPAEAQPDTRVRILTSPSG